MAAKTHDDVDWTSRLPLMRRADRLDADTHAGVAARLTAGLRPAPTLVDVGCGSGGMSASLAAALAANGGGTLVVVDGTEALLAEAESVATRAGGESVRVKAVHADLGGQDLRHLVPEADLVWASAVVHHLPDQQAGINRLVTALRSGGTLALAEGGLPTQHLPADLGVGEPGLERRLLAAKEIWFWEMRGGMEGSVRMPYGWETALGKAGLADVSSFGVLYHHPAPGGEAVRAAAIDAITWLAHGAQERLSASDNAALEQLLDPESPHYLGSRDDLSLLAARTVHFGRMP
ncbi:trans-aconitate 2-methyltransferase [Amycolatopsis sp. cg5]|uniref:class I SAM-dependent methyltransferase n=1 Tax=Amycolatopsis sp. cg5 TaxID=3238802 RepID=UPI00352502A1